MFRTGQELKWARKNAGLTQMALASRTGTTPGYISVLERSAEVPFKIRQRIAEALQVYYPTSPLPSEITTWPPSSPMPEAPAGRSYQRLSPEQKAQNHARQKQEGERLRLVGLRNRQRDAARAQIAAALPQLHALAAAQDWAAYRVVLSDLAEKGNNHHVDAFIAAAQARVVPADDPLVTLPIEPLE